MKSFFRLLADLGWSLIWLFILLIVGFFILNYLSNTFGGNIIGQSAAWVEQNAQPAY